MTISKTLNVSKNDYKFINIALDMAHTSEMLMKHGSVVVQNNRVIGKGCNSRRTQFGDNFIGKSCSCHAEMTALRNALKSKNKGKSSPCRKRVGQRSQCEKVF